MEEEGNPSRGIPGLRPSRPTFLLCSYHTMLSRNASKRSTHKTPALVQTAETAGPAAGTPSSAVPPHSLSCPLPPPPAPTDPAPRESTRPSDILIHRLHEVKRITKSLAAYFEGGAPPLVFLETGCAHGFNAGIAQAHHSHSKTLLNLSTSSAILTPFPESSLFLPTPVPEGQQAGWADLLRQIKDSTSVEAEGHLELGKLVQDEVVAPLKKLVSCSEVDKGRESLRNTVQRVDIKAHIATLDKEVNKFADVVVKERCGSHLSASVVTMLTSPAPGILPSVVSPSSPRPSLRTSRIRSESAPRRILSLFAQRRRCKCASWCPRRTSYSRWRSFGRTRLLRSRREFSIRLGCAGRPGRLPSPCFSLPSHNIDSPTLAAQSSSPQRRSAPRRSLAKSSLSRLTYDPSPFLSRYLAHTLRRPNGITLRSSTTSSPPRLPCVTST